MPSADDIAGRYVDGGSVDWRGLGAALVGGMATVYVVYVLEAASMVGAWLGSLPARAGRWYGAYIRAVFEGLGAGTIETAWSTATAFYAPLGPFAFVVVLVQVWIVMYLLTRGIPHV